MLKNFLSDSAAIKSRRAGLFGPHLDSFVAVVSELGYAGSTARERLRCLGSLEQWLKRKRLVLVDLQEQVVERFLETRRRAGRLRNGDARTVHHFLEHLRNKGILQLTEVPIDRSPLAMLQKQYETYLRKERGLAPVTIGGYWNSTILTGGPVCLRYVARDVITTAFRFPTMSEKQSPPTYDKIGRAAQHAAFSSATRHRIAVLAIPVPSARLSAAL